MKKPKKNYIKKNPIQKLSRKKINNNNPNNKYNNNNSKLLNPFPKEKENLNHFEKRK